MKLSASCTPFEVVPDAIWQNFKRAVQEAAKHWGLEIAISQDLTVSDANQRFWEMQRVMGNGNEDVCQCANTPHGYCDRCKARMYDRLVAKKTDVG